MKWMRIVAVVLALLWAVWWIYFGVASGMSEGMTPGGILLHGAVPGIVFLAAAAIAWRWMFPGGIVLLILGLIVLVGYPIAFSGRFPAATVFAVLLTMALPPIVSGILLILGRKRAR